MPTIWPFYDAGTQMAGTQPATINVWVQWNQQITNGTGYVDPWNTWVATATNSPQQLLTQTQASVWLGWQTQGTAAYIYPTMATPAPTLAHVPPTAPRELTAEELRAQRRRALIRRNRDHSFSLRRKFAQRRARELLLEHISEEQRREYEERKCFHVVTAGGVRKYRISHGVAGNITLVESREPVLDKHGRPIQPGARFCMHGYHPEGEIPAEDHMLAQAFLLGADEAEFLRHANVS